MAIDGLDRIVSFLPMKNRLGTIWYRQRPLGGWNILCVTLACYPQLHWLSAHNQFFDFEEALLRLGLGSFLGLGVACFLSFFGSQDFEKPFPVSVPENTATVLYRGQHNSDHIGYRLSGSAICDNSAPVGLFLECPRCTRREDLLSRPVAEYAGDTTILVLEHFSRCTQHPLFSGTRTISLAQVLGRGW